MTERLHHETIRKYTAALINTFSNTEIQYLLSNNELRTSKVPLSYTAREKSQLLDELSEEQYLNGNINMLPIGYLRFENLTRDLDRNLNKNHKINTKRNPGEIQYSYNSSPYIFDFELSYMCRGMSEATQIIEQIATLFNPNYHIDVNDVSNLSKPTRIPIRLNDIRFEPEDYDYFSSNIVTVSFNIAVVGNLYMPILRAHRVEEYDITLNEIINEDDALRVSMQEWDVNADGEPE